MSWVADTTRTPRSHQSASTLIPSSCRREIRSSFQTTLVLIEPPKTATCERQGIEPGTLKVHADRGPVPKGKTVKQLLIDLDVASSFSRPRVCNDNPFSEAQYRTMKYCPTFPNRFDSFNYAKAFCRDFFATYNDEHRHSGIAYLTPADVHHGRAEEVLGGRQSVINEVFVRNPERFVAGRPKVPALPKAVWINPPEDRTEIELGLP